MAESITIIVHPSAVGDGTLAVADAMRQVLDTLELLEKAAPADDPGRVVWRLARASTNSPFTVVAASASLDPTVSVALVAAEQAVRFRTGVRELIEDGTRPAWMDAAALSTAKRLFDRNLNGVGRTDIGFLEGDVIFITRPEAMRATLNVDQIIIRERLRIEDFSRTEHGSVEGHILAATTYYSKPALVLKERLSGDRVTCVLAADLAERLGPNRHLSDVWKGRRVLVSGALFYGDEGHLAKIEALALEEVREEAVDLNELRSLGLAGGLRPAEYLARRGEDEVG